MKYINDPGNHWHKDDMLDEPDIPGVTSPYVGEDEHSDYTLQDKYYEEYMYGLDSFDDTPF
jgi:hypothetical protein